MSPVPEGKLRLGGMALRNGLLVHGPTHWAASVRDDAGEIRTASGRKPRVRAVDDVPGVRGVVRLGEAFAVIPLVKRSLPQAKLPFESPSVLAVAVGASLTGALLRRRVAGPVGEAAAATLSLAPAVLALRGGELAAYHGVEHKAIAAYESEDADADAADAAKEHDRCGSHLVTPLLASNIAGALLVRRVLERPGPVAGAGVAVASTAAAVEVFAWCERNAGHAGGPRAAAARASRSSACSARASRTSGSSTSAGRRWRRSCAWRLGSRPQSGSPRTGGYLPSCRSTAAARRPSRSSR